MSKRERADRLLVARGVFESRARAQAAIEAGRVVADGRPIRKSSEEISMAAALAAALDSFSLDVAGRICLDVGASTGGFAAGLLEPGARPVDSREFCPGPLRD